ncbi:hypothetical protein ACOBQB_01045 [Streptomyces sp. G5(2025)]|uniref:hypothetical protein n=1 Tax=Streptomyces sp. G5(2025) TaxID=3406628 RepID=UPI003C2121D0
MSTQSRACSAARDPPVLTKGHCCCEPRSAAAITTALAQAHPDRNIKANVVRTTVEALVAEGRIERTKQSSSVFCTAAAPAEDYTAPQPEGSAN